MKSDNKPQAPAKDHPQANGKLQGHNPIESSIVRDPDPDPMPPPPANC